MSKRNYIRFEEIPAELHWVKFKEFFYSTVDNKYLETEGDGYYLINLNRITSICIYESDNLVSVLSLRGKFFI